MKPFALALTAVLVAGSALADDGVTPIGLADDRVETVRERDEQGRVRVLREVRLNERGDYVNHGIWRSWDANGRLLGQGRYAWGKPTGVWTRWATRDDAFLLGTLPFAAFPGPFLSQATYQNGKLEGVWTIYDAHGRPVSEVPFQGGVRHGEAVLRTADGGYYRRSRFEQGLPVGELKQRNENGQLTTIADYAAGRRRFERAERYETGALKLREGWLGPLTRVASPDDPWRLRMAHYEASGEEVRDGVREAWWPNGQRKLRAEYRVGEAIGAAQWWHENGQLAIHGAYEQGLAAGDWTWWRENGVRAAECQYVAGKPVSPWSLWTADGRRMPAEVAGRMVRRPDTTMLR